ncbi:hypothetical protein QE152_g24731 [Popillia japonica]|uniref:Uncharacterized protein n=1 Tax=Popillia japonica TaxID=7064 RepID=A0AAW1K3W1_POPJA
METARKFSDKLKDILDKKVEVKEDESQTRNKTDISSQDVLAIEAEENPVDNIRNRQHLIRDKRKMVVTNLEIQADRMKSVSLANHPIGKIGETVRIPIPDVDRARSDLRNILGVILVGKIGETVRIPIPDVDRARSDLRNILGVILVVEDNNYSIGTKLGKLQQMYSRNQFTICKQSMVAIDDVPESVEVSLRECAKKSSCVGDQGYNRCFCNQKCRTKKCKCRNNGKLCNSKCQQNQKMQMS